MVVCGGGVVVGGGIILLVTAVRKLVGVLLVWISRSFVASMCVAWFLLQVLMRRSLFFYMHFSMFQFVIERTTMPDLAL